MENLSSSFPRYPDLPSRITQDMESKDIIRLQRDLTTNALSLMGEGDKQRYDGLSEGYRRWEKSIVNTFNSIGLNHLERFFKHPNVKQIGMDPNSSARFSFPPGFLSPLHQLPGPFHLRFFPPRFPDHSTFSRFRFTVFGVFSTTLHTDSWGGV